MESLLEILVRPPVPCPLAIHQDDVALIPRYSDPSCRRRVGNFIEKKPAVPLHPRELSPAMASDFRVKCQPQHLFIDQFFNVLGVR
jgi:hypothetical protein